MFLYAAGYCVQIKTAQPAEKNVSSKKKSKTFGTNKKEEGKPQIPNDAYLVDTIEVVIYSEEGSDIIIKSEVERPSLDGNFRTLNEIITERLMYLDAKRFRMISDDESIEKHLKVVQRENNLSADQLKDIFKAAGYTYEEGKQQFGIMTTIGSMLDFRIRSRLVVPDKDIQAYYDAHPEYEPAAFLVQRAVISIAHSGVSKRVLRSELEEVAEGRKGPDFVEWSEPFWINKTDLAENKMFIADMQNGQISMPVEISGQFEMFRMVERKEERLVPLETRYREISNLLRKPLYEKMFDEYEKNLFDSASIVYMNK